MFNFNNLSETNFTSTAGQYLKAYDIHRVTLTKIEKTELKGSKDPNAVYNIVALEFTGCGDSKGVFTTNLFIPTEKDIERPKYQNQNGHESERPSSAENFQYTLMQLIHYINPAGEAKIKENGSKIQAAFDKNFSTGMNLFVDLIVKALSGKNKVEFNLKLVGRNNNGRVYAALPNACGLNKEGEIFPINFIGENLTFSNWELQQMNTMKNAAPTNMDAAEENNPDKNNDGELDLGSVIADLL